MKLGLNNDVAHRVPLSTLIAGHAQFSRFPIRNGHDYRPHVARLQAAGIDPLLILTDEWLTPSERRLTDFWTKWARAARRAFRALPTCAYWQVGNEPDIEGASSETRPAAEYSLMLQVCAWRLRSEKYDRSDSPLTIISAGAANGDPSYWDDVDLSPADAFGLHFATQTPSTIPARVEAYRRFGLPIWATEFYSEHEDRAVQGREVSAMIRVLAAAGVEVSCFYALSDRQYPGGGLVDTHNNGWDSFAAFADAPRG